MTEEKIARINELAHKKKNEGLTEEEQEEQKVLRKAFLDDFKSNLVSQLSNIDVVDENGNVENLGEKYGKKHEQ